MIESQRYALRVSFDPSGQYAHVRASTVAVGDDGAPRNLSTDDAWRVDPMAGIVATAQADREPDNGTRPETYGWALGLEPFCYVAVIPAIVATLATLRKAERAIARAETRFGPPATFGAYLARLADALGVPIMTGTAGPYGTYTGGAWVEWKPGEAVRIIDRWVTEWRKVPA